MLGLFRLRRFIYYELACGKANNFKSPITGDSNFFKNYGTRTSVQMDNVYTITTEELERRDSERSSSRSANERII